MYLLLTGLQSVIFAAVAAGLIFGLAGRWDLWNVWVYVGILLALSLFRDLVMPQKPRLVEGTTQAGEWRTRRQIGDYFRRGFGPVLAALERRRARSALSLVGPYPAGRGGCRISDGGYRCGV